MTEAAIQQSEEGFCDECGALIEKLEAEALTKAEVKTKTRVVAPNGKRKEIAALLAFSPLGSLGIHRFYLGETDGGTMYCALRWTFIPLVMAFIEGIKLMRMSDEAFVEKYGSV